jgi:4-diphosphocytidyl-2-C-methyl-D-erythritol kinase
MQCVTLNDTLTIEDSDDLEVVADSDIPLRDNLVYKAALLMKAGRGAGFGAKITLKKEIPMAAGLGGGSSDAARTLVALNHFWNVNLTLRELAGLGEMLGSDVPFFLYGPVAVVEGRGEIVTPVTLGASYALVLARPPIEVSTAWAYSQVENNTGSGKVLTKGDNNIKLFCQALETRDFSLLSSLRRNDLESLVEKRHPVIGEIKGQLTIEGAVFSAMSGSGPTVFGLFPSREEAERALPKLSPNWCRVVETVASGG